MAGRLLELRRRAGRLERTLVRELRRRAIVLMYHRVVDLAFDPQLLAVSPAHFSEHLAVLRSNYRPIALDDLVAGLDARRLPRRAVVVTMDDGYADNLEHARPILERFDVPATAFIATDALDEGREFWWDELEDVAFAAEPHPDREWNVERADDPRPVYRRYRSLYERLHPLSSAEKRRSLDDLRSKSSREAGPRPTHRTLTVDEARRLADGRLIEVGAHSRSHPALGGLATDDQRAEIVGSRNRLREILGRAPRSFAYPHGSYSPTTVALVREAGYGRACTSDAVVVGAGADPFRIPRVVPRDWDGDTFAAWLRDWLG